MNVTREQFVAAYLQLSGTTEEGAHAALEAEVKRWREPISETYACESCGRRDGLDAVMASDVWEHIRGGMNLLCLWCIDTRCQAAGVQTSATLHFAGLAITGTTQSAADEEHIRRVCRQRDERGAERDALRAALAESCEAVAWLLDDRPASDDPGPGIRSALVRWRAVLEPASSEGRADAAGEG